MAAATNIAGGRAGESGPLSVSAALALAKGALENVSVTLVGEVSEVNVKRGYKAAYFTVKDERGVLPCKMWIDRYRAVGIEVAVGDKLELSGRFSLFPAKGRMDFEVRTIKRAGEGDLRLKVERLAKKLEAEGLMDASRKLPLPEFPQRIGLVTSPRGDVVHDVLRTLRECFPLTEVAFAGVPVEGANAAQGIIEGMRAVYRSGVEAILLVRGGGQWEDFMPFNDEKLARAIVACPLPVVTGLGHEPDTTIADLVADHRSLTPTAAARDVSPAREELDALMAAYGRSLGQSMGRRLEARTQSVAALASRPVFADANYLLADRAQRLDWTADRLFRALPAGLARDKARVEGLEGRLHRAVPQAVRRDGERVRVLSERLHRAIPHAMQRDRAQLAALRGRLAQGGPRSVERAASRVESLSANVAQIGPRLVERPCARVDALRGRLVARSGEATARFSREMAVSAARLHDLSPLTILSRGYAVARDEAGSVVKDVDSVAVGSRVNVAVANGELLCDVMEAKKIVTSLEDWKENA